LLPEVAQLHRLCFPRLRNCTVARELMRNLGAREWG
jgi:hypothetical protein